MIDRKWPANNVIRSGTCTDAAFEVCTGRPQDGLLARQAGPITIDRPMWQGPYSQGLNRTLSRNLGGSVVSSTLNPLSVQVANTHSDKRNAKRATAAAAFGTFVEYYDFAVFGYIAVTVSLLFFPNDNPTAGLVNTMLVFGAAFVVRPLGAIFFGHLADRRGRRTALLASITLMCVAAGGTGLLPTYAQIGELAPICLVSLRMLQGFSAGGEIGTASSYIREWVEPSRRPLYVSLVPSVAVFGKAAAAAMAALIASLLPTEVMNSWGWRLPFLLAVPLGILCLRLRLRIEDSPEFQHLNKQANTSLRPFMTMMREHRRSLALVVSIATVQSVGTYIGTVFVASYLSTVLGFGQSDAAVIVLVATVFASFLIIISGYVGTRVGGRRLLTVAYLCYLAMTVPAFVMMNQGSTALAMLGLSLSMIPYAICQAGTYSILPEFFPTEVRSSGVSFGHSVGAVIGGGGGPYFATWLISVTGNPMIPAFILCGFAFAGLVIVNVAVRPNTEPSEHLFR